MVLRMPCPTKRKGSDNWYYRRTIPADVQRILAKLPRQKRPRGWYKTHISISLGTPDRALAKAKYAEVSARVEQQIKALREGPKPLSPKQVSALSGLLYRAFAERLEEDPVLTADQWRDVAEANREAQRGGFGTAPLLIGLDEKALRKHSLEQRFGKMVDASLIQQQVVTDDASRDRLLEYLSRDLTEAAEKLARNADGDYTTDGYAKRFPDWKSSGAAEASNRTLTGLAEAWRQYAIARMVSARDAKRMSRVLLRFAQWLGHDDAKRVTRTDVVRWTDERIKSGIKASTINKTDTAALRTIFKWGAERGWLNANPLVQNVRVESRGKPTVREKYFSTAEATAILSAALAVKPTQREKPTTTEAKRWVPWLCAYSGSRVSEMIQLRKKDIRREQGAWIIRLDPQAGSIKTNEFRDIPVHEHLLALGFMEFVKVAPDGPLFVEAARDGTVAGPTEGVYSRLRKFVRNVVHDPNVQPNHAWRYTFKTVGLDAGIEEIVLDAICGHRPSYKGRDYTRVTLKKRIEAMSRYPRYPLPGSDTD